MQGSFQRSSSFKSMGSPIKRSGSTKDMSSPFKDAGASIAGLGPSMGSFSPMKSMASRAPKGFMKSSVDIGLVSEFAHDHRVEEQIRNRQAHRLKEHQGDERALMRALHNPFDHHIDYGKRPRMNQLMDRFPPEAHEEIVMRDENIAALPQALDILQHIKKIDVSGNTMHDLSPAVADIKGLLHLDVSQNYLSSLPETLNHLSSLKTLNVRSNQISSLPYLAGMYRLEEMDLSDNQLVQIPRSIADLKSLQVLNVSFCQLRELPLELCELRRSLRILNASYNFIFELPERLGNLASLEALHLCKNRLHFLPTGSVEYMTALKTLDVSHNFLSRIPKAIGLNHGLRTLILGNNEIREIPRTCIALTGLQHLDLSNNILTRLPEITSLVNLTNLHVDNNQLERLPIRMYTITNLTQLEARGNSRLVLPPLSIALQGTSHILEYLRCEDERDARKGIHSEELRNFMFKLLDHHPDEDALYVSFERFDYNQGGSLSLREFYAWLQALGMSDEEMSVESTEFLCSALADTGSDSVTWKDLLRMYRRFVRERDQEEDGDDGDTDNFLSKMRNALVDAEMNQAANEAEASAARARAKYLERQKQKKQAAGGGGGGAGVGSGKRSPKKRMSTGSSSKRHL